VKDYLLKGHIYFTDDDLINELSTLKFTFDNNQRRILISKEKMRKEGVKSPNLADALIMAVSMIGEIKYNQDKQYYNLPALYKETDMLKEAGIR
jgi:phage terminase large subunit